MARLCCVLVLLLPLASSTDDGFATSDDNVDTVQMGMDGAGHHDHTHLAARAEHHAHHRHDASNDSQAQLNHSKRAVAMLESRHEGLDGSLTRKNPRRRAPPRRRRFRRRRAPTPQPTASCTCSNGAGQVGYPCTSQGTSKCKKTGCNPGYSFRLDDSTCNLKKCTCSNGVGKKGKACKNDGQPGCASCNTGWHPSGVNCEANTCTCPGGTAATGDKCAVDNKAKCTGCSDNTKYMLSQGDESSCHSCSGCSLGQSIKTVCSLHSDTVCQCAIGHFGAPSSCNECTGKMFADGPGMKICKTCPDGTNGVPAGTGNHGNSRCENSKCYHPSLPANAMVDTAKCPNEGAIGSSTCELKCNPGFTRESHTKYDCNADSGKTSASYQGGTIACKAFQCKCDFGTGTQGPQCPEPGAKKCGECHQGYQLAGDSTCVAFECSCNNGVGAKAAECPSMGAAKCTSCGRGYNLVTNSCKANQCTCEYGHGATATDCETNGKPKCMSCRRGYTLQLDNTCKENTCTCPHGNEAKGAALCPTQGFVKCDDCDAGYHKSGNTCVANICKCENGQGAKLEDCPEHDSFLCDSCSGAFWLNGIACDACASCNGVGSEVNSGCTADEDTTCQCSRGFFGTPAEGCTPCSDNEYQDNAGSDACKKCADGAAGENDAGEVGNTVCISSKCQRPAPGLNAVVATSFCPGDAEQGAKCKQNCKPAYEVIESVPHTCKAVDGSHLSKYQDGKISCELRQCTCGNGTAATGLNCPTQGTAKCATCNPGYHKERAGAHPAPRPATADASMLSDTIATSPHHTKHTHHTHHASLLQKGNKARKSPGSALCHANKCECENGQGATAADCANHGDTKCASCDNGFDLVNHACVERVCICSNGDPTTGAACPASGNASCDNCFPGYNKVGSRCRENVCKCENGAGATGENCEQNGNKKCESCNATFYLASSLCVACSGCQDGSEVLTKCSAGNDTVCQCSRGYVGNHDACTACIQEQFQDAKGQMKCKNCSDGATGTGEEGSGNTGCLNNKCQRPAPPQNAQVDESNCPNEADHGAVCKLLCAEGYEAESNAVPYKCEAVKDSEDAAYQDGSIACKPNQCVCTNGVNANGTACPVAGADKCTACNQGYRLVNGTCEMKVCTCENGPPARGLNCPAHSARKCRNCTRGFTLVDGDCTTNKCECDGGVGTTGADCPHPGRPTCESCDTGYTLKNKSIGPGYTCKLNQCACPNGEAANGTNCPEDGEAKCASCNDYFELGYDKCLPCSKGGEDRNPVGVNASGSCCAGLTECPEPRDQDDVSYCDKEDPEHGQSCWHQKIMCRGICNLPVPDPVPTGGCVAFSMEACRTAAERAGLKLGDEGYEFTGDYTTKGCHAYSTGSNAGKAFYGTRGNHDQVKASIEESSPRKYRPAGYDCSPEVGPSRNSDSSSNAGSNNAASDNAGSNNAPTTPAPTPLATMPAPTTPDATTPTTADNAADNDYYYPSNNAADYDYYYIKT